MRRATIGFMLGLLALVSLAIVASPARADVTVIGFDDQPAGTPIAEQYASLGVHFGPSPFVGQSGALTTVARTQAHSSPDAAALAYDPDTDFSSSWIQFDSQQSMVSFYACRTGTAGGLTPNINAVAYDSNGNVVANVTGVTCTADGPMIPVTLTADHISYVNVYATGGAAAPGDGWAIDDLSFDTNPPVQPPPPPPPPPPPAATPDFSLLRLQGPTAPDVVAVAPGATATAQFVVGRNETSTGPVALSVAGLPEGVTATFDNAAPTGDSPALVTLTLTAASGALPGAAELTITGTPQSGAVGPAPHTVGLDIVVQGHLAAFVKGIEVTQGTQTTAQPDFTDYEGVRLLQGKPTVVRVYVGFLGTVAPGVLPQIGLSLTGNDASGKALPGVTLLPDWSPPASELTVNQLGIGTDERVSPSQAFVFTLPDSWTRYPSIALRAQVLAPEDPSPFNRSGASGATLCLDSACGARSSRDLNGIGFETPPPTQAISAVEQDLNTYNSSGRVIATAKPLDAQSTFARMIQVSPVPFSFLDAAGHASPIPTYRAVRTPPSTAIWEDADAFDASIGRPGHSTFGVFNERSGAGVTFTPRTSVGTSDPTSSGAVDRPLTVIAHEMFHTFGIKHADQTIALGGCGGGVANPAFDAQGHLTSVGTDISILSGGPVGGPPYRMIPDNTSTTPTFDFMSYCATNGLGDPNSWVSATNWNAVLADVTGHAVRAANNVSGPSVDVARTAAAPKGATLHVRASTGPGPVAIQQVDRLTAPTPGQSPTPYTLVGLDAAGHPVSSTAMTGTAVTAERESYGSFEVLDGRLPAAGVKRAEVVLAGSVLASRTASPHAPIATLAVPTVGRGRTVTVHWRARDRDGDALTAELDYSADDGRTFHDIYAGPAGLPVRLPVGLFAPSRHARLRLMLNDGFNETTVLSAPFVVAPRRPTVTILMPAGRRRVATGSSLFLSGAAVDAAGRVIPAARLHWFADRHALGAGPRISAVLPAGTRRVRLVATDARGVSATASVHVSLAPTTPFFLGLKTSRRVSHRATSVTLKVVATQPARLRIGSARFAVGRRARRIRVTIHSGRGTLTLRLHLSAGGRSIMQPVVVSRGPR